MQEVKVTKRRLTPQQKAKQLKIINKTTRLLAKYGSQVSMEMVGEAAQVSRSTLYRYYVSREHLVAEVTLEVGNNLISYLELNPPKGKTIGDKIAFLCEQIVFMAEGSPRLLAACVNNLASDDPAVIDAHAEIETTAAGERKRRGILSDTHGIVQRQEHEVGTKAHLLRAGSNGRGQHQG